MIKGFPDLPPIWWATSIGLIYFAKWLLPEVHWSNPFLTLVSWLIMAVALAVIAWSGIWFWRKRTPIEPHHKPKALIVEGPYRLSRNPIYLALVLLTVGSAIGHGSIIGFGIAALFWWVLDRRFASVEAILLRETFGSDADAYLSQTRRWV